MKIPTMIPKLVRCSLPYLLAMGMSSSKHMKTMIPATRAESSPRQPSNVERELLAIAAVHPMREAAVRKFLLPAQEN